MAWKGLPGDEGIYWNTSNGTTWAAQTVIGGVAGSSGPGIAAFDSAIYAVWKGEMNDDRLWWSKFNGTTWAPQQVIANVGSGGDVQA